MITSALQWALGNGMGNGKKVRFCVDKWTEGEGTLEELVKLDMFEGEKNKSVICASFRKVGLGQD